MSSTSQDYGGSHSSYQRSLDEIRAMLPLDHLKAESPQVFGDVKDWSELVQDGVGLDKVAYVAERGTFMGVCEVCRGWHEGDRRNDQDANELW